MPVDKICERCSQPFKVRPRDAGQRFCGIVCKRAHESVFGRENARIPNVSFTCKTCKKPFSHKPSVVRAYHKKFGKDPLYCSMRCSDIGRREDSDANNAITCIQCGKLFSPPRKPGGTLNRRKRLCSTACRAQFRRVSYQLNNPNQPTTKRVVKNGYVRMIIPGTNGQPSRDVFEHRYVMEKDLGRNLRPEETVHHINGNRQDNRLENLELFSSRHGPGQRVTDKVTFAIEILRLYPEFAKAVGVELRDVAHVTAEENSHETR